MTAAGLDGEEDSAASEGEEEEGKERRDDYSEDGAEDVQGGDSEEEEEEVEEYLDEGRPDDVGELMRRAAELPTDMRPVYRSVGHWEGWDAIQIGGPSTAGDTICTLLSQCYQLLAPMIDSGLLHFRLLFGFQGVTLNGYVALGASVAKCVCRSHLQLMDLLAM